MNIKDDLISISDSKTLVINTDDKFHIKIEDIKVIKGSAKMVNSFAMFPFGIETTTYSYGKLKIKTNQNEYKIKIKGQLQKWLRCHKSSQGT